MGRRLIALIVLVTALGASSGYADSDGWKVPVLELKFFPTRDGVHLDAAEVGRDLAPGTTLTDIRQRVETLSESTVEALTQGSIYHGYRYPGATPSLRYKIYTSKEFLEPVPRSAQFRPFADHLRILTDVDVCDYVESHGVKEVWIWMYHSDHVVPIESNMAGPFGDISNSHRQPDLPVCAKTYTVYNYNYGRGLGETLENHGHQIESVFGYVDQALWRLYTGPVGSQPGPRRCGNVHTPPNGASDYDWANEASVLSDCETWSPEGSGANQRVSCHTWYSPTCRNNGGIEYKVWWMQNIPGRKHRLTYRGAPLQNWWVFFGDFDAAMTAGRTLLEPSSVKRSE